MIPKRDRNTNIANEVARGKQLRQKITSLAEEVASRFMKGENLNTIVAEIAKREKFNRLQIQRLIEESNTVAYNKRYAEMKGTHDRRISFDLAEMNQILDKLGDAAPPEMVNPNLAEKTNEEPSMPKAAGIESTPIHNLNRHTDRYRETMMQKTASAQKAEQAQVFHKLERFVEQGVFKIANTLVQTEKLYKKANETFNTLLDDIVLDAHLTDRIQKVASEIADGLIKTKRVRPNFVVSLEMKPSEKVASYVLGEYSLIKEAQEHARKESPKIAPTGDISNYEKMIHLARQIQQQHSDMLQIQQPKED